MYPCVPGQRYEFVMDLASRLRYLTLFRQQAYVDGEWFDGDSSRVVSLSDPAPIKVIGTVPDMGGAETRKVRERAEGAWPAWRAKTAKERGCPLR